jgi:glycerophosphoryl diester phosphodiesterase
MTTTHRMRPVPARQRAGLRPLGAAFAVVAATLVLILDPGAATVYAAHPMGALRGPGEPAFIAAHRGDRALAPENTIPAFEAAFASGSQFVETDLQLTADGQVVLMHDDTVDRTTDGTGAVSALTLAEIRALDAGSWYGTDFAGTRVPVLEEFLDLLARASRPGATALLELKGFWREADVRQVLSAVYLRGVQDRVVFASFHLGTIENARAAAPAIPRVVIQQQLSPDPVGLARFYGAIAILTTPGSVEDAPDVIGDMHAAGLGVLLYTLNTENRWSEALALGVDGIVTDTPSALDSWIAATAPGT